MSITHVTEFHAAAGQESTLIDLLIEGRNRMLARVSFASDMGPLSGWFCQ